MWVWFNKVEALIESWGLTGTVATGVGVITLLIILFMPFNGVEHSDEFAGLNYAIAVTAAGVTSVIAVPQVWLHGVGVLYTLFFCLLVGSLALVRFRLGGNEVKVVVKTAKSKEGVKPSK
ncbi:MAG: hypothetical protein RIQ81_863 [Pseudomonadota bacterium]